MPYEIKKSGSKFCVHKEGGAQIACHSSRKGALQQMKALYANEKADLASLQIGCDSCERAFLSDEAYLQHAEAVHEDKSSHGEHKKPVSGSDERAEIVKCEPCNREFLSERAMAQHSEAVHGVDAASHQHNGAEHTGSSHVASLGCDRCNRSFYSVQGLKDHASEVHDKALDENNTTYSDKEQMVRKALQEKLTGSAYSRVWCWIADMTDAWVVYSVEGSDNLQKADYTIAEDNTVTIGDPTTVRRATVYETVGS